MKFEDWIHANADEIEQIQEFTKSDLPIEAGQIQQDLNRTATSYPRVGEWLADCERFLTTYRAIETMSVKTDPHYEDLAAPERKVIVEGNLAEIVHVRDILKTTARALEERHFSLLNQRNFAKTEMRMTAHAD